MADNTRHNPWKGLNFYIEGEILYGRNVEILSLSQYIFNNTQTVLYGRSGIGKSSILNAGIFPKARLNGLTPISIRLKHSDENDYLEQIKEGMVAGGLIAKELVAPINANGEESLWEYLHRHTFVDANTGRESVPLLVFDQFEEIFTLQTNETIKRNFFRELGDLLNDVKPSYVVEHESRLRQQQTQQQATKVVSTGAFKGLNLKLNVMKSDGRQENASRYVERPDYHIVFALREDFLSSLEYYASSIPVMKDNRYGLLPLNEEQAADIIRLPEPGLVDDAVTKLIIEQVTGRTDFILDGIPEIEVDAAVLSLFLSRLYIKKAENEPCITADLVHTSGGHIIHDFYEESIKSDESKNEILSPESIKILEDNLLTSEGRRNNMSRGDLIALGVTDSELRILTDRRKLLRQFHHGNDIRVEYIHDILCPVVKERKMQREQLRLQELEHERQEQEKQQIIEEAEARAKRTRHRNRQIFFWTAIIALVLATVGVYSWYVKVYIPNKVHENYYAGFELVNGWPVGVNELSEDERAKTPLYYKLSHVGEGTTDTDVEVMSSNSMLPSTVRITNWPEICEDDNDRAGKAFNEILRKVKHMHFTPAENGGKVGQTYLKDADDNLLMIMSYFHLNDQEAWLKYSDIAGQSMPIRDNGIDRVKMSWDSVGRIEYQRYYTTSNVAKPIHAEKDIAGYYRTYGSNNPTQTDYYTLNIYGLPTTNIPYNLKRVRLENDTLITEYFKVRSLDDDKPVEAIGDHGYSRTEEIGNVDKLYIPKVKEPVATSITEFDSFGNPIMQTITGSVNDSLPPVIKWEYKGNTGLMAKKMYLTRDNKPYAKNASDVYRWEMQYDDNGNTISERRYDISEGLVYSNDRYETTKGDVKIVTDVLNDLQAGKYLTRVDSISANRVATSFYGKDGVRINESVPFWADDSVKCHYYVVETDGSDKTFKHYAVNDNGAVEPIATTLNPDSYRSTSFSLLKRFDENGNVTNMEIKDAEGNIITRMMYFIQNGETIGRAVWGIDDTPARCPDWEEEGFSYYKIYYSKDINNNYVFLQPFDEWMNISLFLMDGNYLNVSSIDLKDKKVLLQEGNLYREVSIYSPLSIPEFTKDTTLTNMEMPYLHLLSKSSPLYKSGLRDGDRIVGIGNWKSGEPQSKFFKEWNNLKKSGREATITVNRPTDTGFRKIKRTVVCEPGDELDAHVHFMNLSKSEKKFYENHQDNE